MVGWKLEKQRRRPASTSLCASVPPPHALAGTRACELGWAQIRRRSRIGTTAVAGNRRRERLEWEGRWLIGDGEDEHTAPLGKPEEAEWRRQVAEVTFDLRRRMPLPSAAARSRAPPSPALTRSICSQSPINVVFLFGPGEVILFFRVESAKRWT